MLTSTLAVSMTHTFMTLTTTMHEYNQYHYPPQNYDEGWDNYNYEEESPAVTYAPAVINQGEEPDEDYNTREGLLCEEDAEVSFFSDNLQQ